MSWTQIKGILKLRKLRWADLGKPELSPPRHLGVMPVFQHMTKVQSQLHVVISVTWVFRTCKQRRTVFVIAQSHCSQSPQNCTTPRIISLLGCFCQSKGKSTQYATQVLYMDTWQGIVLSHYEWAFLYYYYFIFFDISVLKSIWNNVGRLLAHSSSLLAGNGGVCGSYYESSTAEIR